MKIMGLHFWKQQQQQLIKPWKRVPITKTDIAIVANTAISRGATTIAKQPFSFLSCKDYYLTLTFIAMDQQHV